MGLLGNKTKPKTITIDAALSPLLLCACGRRANPANKVTTGVLDLPGRFYVYLCDGHEEARQANKATRAFHRKETVEAKEEISGDD